MKKRLHVLTPQHYLHLGRIGLPVLRNPTLRCTDEEYMEAEQAWRATHPRATDAEIHTKVLGHLAWQQHQAEIREGATAKHIDHRRELKAIAIALLILAAVLLVPQAHCQFSKVSYINLENSDNSTAAFFTFPFNLKVGANCSWAVSGATATINCAGGAAGAGGTNGQTQYNNAGSLAGIAEGTAGQVLESNGVGNAPGFADPIVSGPDATGAASTKNPVQTGALDNSTSCAGSPCVRFFILSSSTPAGTEYGLITRNIPGGTQTVSGSGTFATSSAQLPGALDGSGFLRTHEQGTAAVSGTVTANIGSSGSLALDASVTGLEVAQASTTSGQKGVVAQGAVTTNAPTYTTAQTNPLSLDVSGNLRVSLKDTPQNTTALKVDGSGVTQPVSGTVTANQGTANATPWNENIAQILGAAPSATNPLYIRETDGTNTVQAIDPCRLLANSFARISETANTQVISGVSAKKTYICSINLVTAGANNVAIVEGTGTVCATGIAGVSTGGTTAATGWNFAANGGLTQGDGRASIMLAGNAAADNVCILQSAAVQLSGVIGYVQQ